MKIFILQCTCNKYDLTWLKTYWCTQFQPKSRERAGGRFGVRRVEGRLARAKSGAVTVIILDCSLKGHFPWRPWEQAGGRYWNTGLGWAWNSGNQTQTRALSCCFCVRSAKSTESNEAKLHARNLRLIFSQISPAFPFTYLTYFASCFLLLLTSHPLPPRAPSFSFWQTASLELLRDVLLLSRSSSENWFPAVHFSSVVIPSCLLYSCFSLIFLALIKVPVRNKRCFCWLQMGNTEETTKKVIKKL